VDYDRIQQFAADPGLPQEQQRLRDLLDLRSDIIGLGVDRLDYTKGIPERLDALHTLMARRPDLRGRLTFVQIGVPSRSDLKSYSAIEAEIGARVAALNVRYAVPGGSPVVSYSTTPLDAFSLVALYRLAHFCIVSSLHDGMNLVAKEFVAARDDEQGVLVLSALAGAAQELEDALIINPYDVEAFATALARAIDMPREEQTARMRAMRKVVAGRNVFNWASDILEGLESLWTKPLLYSVRGWEETSV
jgi:trehalose 6-phosphate synthase